MKLEEGMTIRLIKKSTTAFSEHIGIVEKIYKNFILLKFKKYKECILIADILNRKDYRLNAKKDKKDKKWIEVNIDMLRR